ncbi:glycosyl hydrolase family 61-domain-containing protein, partial [Vararia minispora EC-137]
MKSCTLFAAVALATSSYAHTIFQALYVNGVDQGHINGIRVPSYDGPITDVTSNDLICNGGINPYQQPVSQVIINATAGDSITAEWHHTLAGANPSDSQDPIDSSHKGNCANDLYSAKVPSALQTSVTGLQWFKIYEDGYSSSTGLWAVDTLIANKGKVTFSLPSCIAAGQYLLRVEVIALHAATSYPGAQFYMECAQLQISGGGSASPATVSFPGAYKGTDPGVTINIYYPPVTSYTIPGPPVFSCSGNSGSAPAPPSSSPAATSKAASSTAPAAPSSTPSSPSGSVAHYGQCGGVGYSGPTACASPYSCVVSSAYVS